nr:MAG TPA: hypothetical protein [Caudoviricetes sp.]
MCSLGVHSLKTPSKLYFPIYACIKNKQSNFTHSTYPNVAKLLIFKQFTSCFLCIYCSMGFL